jgi:hypothetical protein
MSEEEIEIYNPCEWVVQFDEDEPQVFASTNEEDTEEQPEINITLQNTSESHLIFEDTKTGKTFRIYARPKSK